MSSTHTFASRTAAVKNSLSAKPASDNKNYSSASRQLGNKVVQRKIQVGSENDAYEREADRSAEAVMRMPAGSALPPPSKGPSARIQRKCEKCDDEEKTVRRKPLATSSAVNSVPEIDNALTNGSPLARADNDFFSSRFNTDFSPVRVHTDTQASNTAAQLQARAFTYGSDIVFNRGEYQPGSFSGRRLIAHELTHVIQQSHSSGAPPLQRTATRGAGGCGPLRELDEDADGARAAGSAAHIQIQSFLMPAINGELPTPRATKRQIDNTGCQAESVNAGRADLWKVGGEIGIAEIKPFGFATRNHIAQQEADHYIRRSTQSADRFFQSGSGVGSCASDPRGADDTAFARRIGMRAGLTNRKTFGRLTGILSSDTTIGSFDGDRSRTLKARMTEAGSVGYWCTGGRSDTFPCDATGNQIDEYIDSILSNAQGLLDDFIRDRFERPLQTALESFDIAELLRAGKQLFWPQIRDALRQELGPVGGALIPDDISVEELAQLLDSQLGPTARSIIITLMRRFKSLVLNELRRMMRDSLRSMIREALAALCVGVPVVTLATLLDKLKEMFEEQAKQFIPVAVTVAMTAIASEIINAIAEAAAEIGSVILRALAVIALVIVALAALFFLAVTIIALIDPVPGDEVAAAAITAALARLVQSLGQFVLNGARAAPSFSPLLSF